MWSFLTFMLIYVLTRLNQPYINIVTSISLVPPAENHLYSIHVEITYDILHVSHVMCTVVIEDTE